jgi:hypothetical protein
MLTTVALTVLATLCGMAQQTPTILRGTWSASIGTSRVIRGSWSARIDSAKRDAAGGAWAIVDDRNRVMLEGVWSAVKSAQGWNGTWSARTGTTASGAGRTFSGTWRADIKDAEVKTLGDMLQRTVVDQVTGSWRSGSLEGQWRLQGAQR